MDIILWDNPSRFDTGTCWSPNVWKTRLLLNFKRLDYRTQWIHGPDIAPTFRSFGIRPHEPGSQMADFTLPMIQLPNGAYCMESRAIAHAIEKLYPSPSAHLDLPILNQVNTIMSRDVLKHLAPVLVPLMPRECLSGPSIEYHREARKVTYGMSLEDLEAIKGGEPAWERGMPGLKALAQILNEDQSGPFCLGATPSYADFIIVGFLEWCKCLQGDILERIFKIDPAFGVIFSACEQWLLGNGSQ